MSYILPIPGQRPIRPHEDKMNRIPQQPLPQMPLPNRPMQSPPPGMSVNTTGARVQNAQAQAPQQTFMNKLSAASPAFLALGAGLLGGRTGPEQWAMGAKGFSSGVAGIKEKKGTLQWLEAVNPKMAEAVRNGMPIEQAVNIAQAEIKNRQTAGGSSFGNLQRQAMAAGLKPGSPEYQDFMRNGGGAPATFRSLDMQAKAAGHQPGTPGYENFMATRGKGEQTYAGQTGTNRANIESGGKAEGAKMRGEKSMEAGFKAYTDYGKIMYGVSNIDEAISAIDGGARAGFVISKLPSLSEESASLEVALNRMGLDIIGMVTFGALSEAEMNIAMQTAAPRTLDPVELRKWLVDRKAALQKTADLMIEAADFLTSGGQIDDWIAKVKRRNGAASDAPSNAPPMSDMTPEQQMLWDQLQKRNNNG